MPFPMLDHPLTDQIHHSLLAELQIASVSAVDPIVVQYLPTPWQVLGCGNYAAVFAHPDFPEVVVKVYAPDRPGIEDEKAVYRCLGHHPAFSACHYEGSNFLILKRLHGITLYDCLHQGHRIPPQAIRDINHALDYARSQGLFPHDVHGRNVMVYQSAGYVVDVSDFLKRGDCYAWRDLCWAYRWIYRPIVGPLGLRIPYVVLDCLRASYRRSRHIIRSFRRQRA
jgi:hypothetical protein